MFSNARSGYEFFLPAQNGTTAQLDNCPRLPKIALLVMVAERNILLRP